jgi:NAD(P)-dependent dehydrogenase (short-subunit alcohol dehydrogenase family)
VRLAGKVAIVTGGARGIGAAIAARFCQEGAAVLIADLRGDAAGATAAALREHERRCEPVEADVSTETGWEAILAACHQHFGVADVLVNNAGVSRYQPLLEETLDGWRAVLDANLTSVFLGMRAVIPLMAAGGGGAIVNVSSTWGLVAAEKAAAYHASKGGVTLLTKNAAVTYAGQQIRVNSIHPGPVATTMLDELTDEAIAVELAKQPLGRLADPDEIATAAVYLASDEASFVTGAALVVDGGYTAR